jgi:hypothetical protein
MHALAETMTDVETRVIMVRLADDYDKLADRAGRLADDGEAAPKDRCRGDVTLSLKTPWRARRPGR